MLSHVLIPLDGSQLAEEALAHAQGIVSEKGKITLLTAVDVPEVPMYGLYPPTAIPDYQTAIEDALPRARAYLEGIAKELTSAGFSVVTLAQNGNASEVITRTAQELHVDAIIMSTHGRSGLSRWLLGSVTNKVLSAKVCPVFVIPNKQPEGELPYNVEIVEV